MNLHLAEIAAAVAPAAHAVLLVDQAGWHMSTRLVVPANITIIALPPKCPELNPVENVWQFMRDNWLSNRIFKSYDDLVDHCCEAWNKLVDQPWHIMSIGFRQWPHEFSSMRLRISSPRNGPFRPGSHRSHHRLFFISLRRLRHGRGHGAARRSAQLFRRCHGDDSLFDHPAVRQWLARFAMAEICPVAHFRLVCGRR